MEGRSVTLVEFSPESPLSLVTVHGGGEKICYVCLWNVARPQAPSQVFRCSSEVTAVCPMGDILLGGSRQGAVLAWDGRESLSTHQQVQGRDDSMAR